MSAYRESQALRPLTRTERVSATQLDTIAMSLTKRDLEILRTLAAYRLVSGEQLRRLHFTGHATRASAARTAVRVLGRLYQLHLIDRLERRIGGVHAGSAGFVWHLARVGRRLLERETSDVNRLPRVAAIEPAERTVAHTLAITEVGVRLHELAQTGQLEVIECVPEPACWRSYLNAGGGLSWLKPDLWAVTATPSSDAEDLWFCEIDMGREPIATIVRKAEQYEAYRRTGKEQQAQGVFPKVAWLTKDGKRAARITDALRKASRVDERVHGAMRAEEFLDHVAPQLASRSDTPHSTRALDTPSDHPHRRGGQSEVPTASAQSKESDGGLNVTRDVYSRNHHRHPYGSRHALGDTDRMDRLAQTKTSEETS